MEHIVPGTADHPLHVEQGVALRLSAARGCAVEEDFNPCSAARKIDRSAVVGGIRPAFAIDRVRARAAHNDVIRIIAGQRVIARRTGDVFNSGVFVALRRAAAALAGEQVDAHGIARARVVDRVRTVAAIDLVRADAGIDQVIPFARIDHVARRIGKQHVDGIAGHRVGGGHIGLGTDLSDAEAVGNLDGKGAGLAIARKAQLDRQIEIVLKTAFARGRTGSGHGINQLQVKFEQRLFGWNRDCLAGFVGGCRYLGDFSRIDVNQPAPVADNPVGDRIAFGKRWHEHFKQIEVPRRDHRLHMQHAHGRAGRRVQRIVCVDNIIAGGAADRLRRRLRGKGGVGGRIRTPGFAGQHRIASDGGLGLPFGIKQRVLELGHEPADPGRTQGIVRRGFDRPCRRRRGRRARRGLRIADLFGELLGIRVELVPRLLFGGSLCLGFGGILRLNRRARFLARLG